MSTKIALPKDPKKSKKAISFTRDEMFSLQCACRDGEKAWTEDLAVASDESFKKLCKDNIAKLAALRVKIDNAQTNYKGWR